MTILDVFHSSAYKHIFTRLKNDFDKLIKLVPLKIIFVTHIRHQHRLSPFFVGKTTSNSTAWATQGNGLHTQEYKLRYLI